MKRHCLNNKCDAVMDLPPREPIWDILTGWSTPPPKCRYCGVITEETEEPYRLPKGDDRNEKKKED